MTDTAKRKLVDWDKKNNDDSSRIITRAQKRPLAKKDTFPDTATRPPRATGIPLMRLRQKINEVYNTDDDDEDLLFDISLFEEETETQKQNKQTNDTIYLTKQQQLTGKLNLIMSSALVAQEAGLSPQMTAEDSRLANTAEYDVKKLRRQTLKNKVEEPLKLKGTLPESQLDKAVKGLKQAKENLPPDSLEDFPADEASLLAILDEEDMAELILKKSGRQKKPKTKKKLSEIAKGLNQFKEWDNPPLKKDENA